MLLAHFRLAETDNPRFDPDNFDHETATNRIEAAAREALRATHRRLQMTTGYDLDGQTPFLLPYVTDFQTERGLDSATAWGEQYSWGQGVHVGLVFEGRASGPMYHKADGWPGVRRKDFSTIPIEDFARALSNQLTPDLLPFELAPTYVVTDWSFYERVSRPLTLPA